MRYESKNSQMKGFVTNCFKNVPLSVSIRHQQWLSYHLAVRPGQSTSRFIYSGDQIISGTYNSLKHLYFHTKKETRQTLANSELKLKITLGQLMETLLVLGNSKDLGSSLLCQFH